MDERALIAWHMAPISDRSKILAALEALVGSAPEHYPPGDVRLWRPDRDLSTYSYPSPDGEVLVWFYPKDGRIHIDSLAPKARYDLSIPSWVEPDHRLVLETRRDDPHRRI